VYPIVYRAAAVVSLAIVLAVAGCSGLVATPTPTTTPAPVPTPPPTATPVPELAPGLTVRGVVDPGRLAAAHLDALGGNTTGGPSYTLRSTYVERYRNGTVRARVDTHHAVATSRSYHRVRWTGHAKRVYGLEPPAPPRGRAETFCTDGRCLRAVTTADATASVADPAANGTTYREGGVFGPVFVTVTDRQQVSGLFGTLATAVTGEVVRNGTTYYRLEATGVSNPAVLDFPQEGGVRDISFVALVSPSGLIRDYRLSYVDERGQVTVRVVRTARFAAVGTTTVERPPWYDTVGQNGR